MGEGGCGVGLRARDARLCDALASARSIGQSMPSVLGFADEVVDGFVIGESTTHVGVVQFNGDAQLLLPLSADEGSVREAIARGGPSYGYTSISDGIDAAMATLGGHGRAGVPVTMLVLTDGAQTVDGVATSRRLRRRPPPGRRACSCLPSASVLARSCRHSDLMCT